jgi:hypothetical protein
MAEDFEAEMRCCINMYNRDEQVGLHWDQGQNKKAAAFVLFSALG